MCLASAAEQAKPSSTQPAAAGTDRSKRGLLAAPLVASPYAAVAAPYAAPYVAAAPYAAAPYAVAAPYAAPYVSSYSTYPYVARTFASPYAYYP